MGSNTFQRRDLSKRLALIFTGLSSVISFLLMYVHVISRCKSRGLVRNVLNASGEREHMYRRARHARRIRAKYVCYSRVTWSDCMPLETLGARASNASKYSNQIRQDSTLSLPSQAFPSESPVDVLQLHKFLYHISLSLCH